MRNHIVGVGLFFGHTLYAGIGSLQFVMVRNEKVINLIKTFTITQTFFRDPAFLMYGCTLILFILTYLWVKMSIISSYMVQ